MTGYEQTGVHQGDDGIPRDRYGRYVLPDPETGQTRTWTRVTTIAGSLKDRYGLEKWAQRNLVYGLGQRQALYAQAAASSLDDRTTLDEIARRAQEAADSSAGADLGSALHTFTERIDQGEPDVVVPAPYDRDIAAYRTALDTLGITAVPDGIERVVALPELGVCGTLDRIVTAPARGLPLIGDVKTAKDKPDGRGGTLNTVLRYGMVDIPLQLAMYAHATHWWDTDTGQWQEKPAVDQTVALVFHVPAGAGVCRIYEVDISAGWQAVQLAFDIKTWRGRGDLCQILTEVTAGDGSHLEPAANGDGQTLSPASGLPEAIAWARTRVDAIKAHPQARARLAELWSTIPDIPTFPRGGPRTNDEVDKVAAWCELVEMEFGLPFGPADPRPQPDRPSVTRQQREHAAAAADARGKAIGRAQARRTTKEKAE